MISSFLELIINLVVQFFWGGGGGGVCFSGAHVITGWILNFRLLGCVCEREREREFEGECRG